MLNKISINYLLYSIIIELFMVLGIDDGFMYSCDMCNFKTIRKDIYMLHIVKHKEETLQNNGICEPLVSLDEVRYEYLYNKIIFKFKVYINIV